MNNKAIYESFEHFELRRLNRKANILLTYTSNDSRLADQHEYKFLGTTIDGDGRECSVYLMPQQLSKRSNSTYCRNSYFG